MTDFLDEIRRLSPKQLMLLAFEQHERLEAATRREAIAVIGIGCRLPGADTPEAFWDLLDAGRDAVREVPPDRWDPSELFDSDADAPGRISMRSAGFIDDVAGFDASFFGIAPREARSMDPQQRLVLETAWEALEHAGIPPDRLAGSATGVFVGQCTGDYLQRLVRRGREAIDAYFASGTSSSVTSGRLAYSLGLRGPALTLDTSCSSSLVALHLACRSLRDGESRVALVAGVNVICAPEAAIALSKAHMLAPDGRSKAFDAAADGLGRGEGCVALVLKRLSDARADGDTILALVRGTAVNQDGRSAGLTVPNGPAQEAVIAEALADAGVSPSAIGYVEAHGTGTFVGDQIEIRALSNALCAQRSDAQPLLVGSVKANIGHLEAAAGLAGVLKAILCLQHGRIPPQPHFHTPSPHIPWADSRVAVSARGQAWPSGSGPRLAGVSSFGFSGTNAHAILEAPPPADVRESASAAPRLPIPCLPLSARSEPALRELAKRYADLLAAGADLAAISRDAAACRSHHAVRLAVVADDARQAAQALRAYAAGQTHPAALYTQADTRSTGDSGEFQTPAGLEAAGRLEFLGDSPDAPLLERVRTLLGPGLASTGTPGAAGDWRAIGRALAERYVGGAAIDWAALGGTRGATRLPAYPFQHERFWVDEPRPAQTAAANRLFYEVAWQPLEPFADARATTPRRWTLVGDGDGIAAALAARLRARGDVVTRADVADDDAALDGDLVYLEALALSAGSSAEACTELACAAPIRWLARFARGTPTELPDGAPPRAWLVTRGAQAVSGELGPGGRFQAPLWGVGRVFGLEEPRRWGGLLDLPSTSEAESVEAIVRVLDTVSDEDQLAYRAGRFFGARLERAPAPEPRALELSSDATYLVTGGFGGLGLLVGRWLAERGARHIALLGRTPDMHSAGVRAIQDAGARVFALKGDVADAAGLRTLLAGLASEAPPLRGIVHAAATISIATIAGVTQAEIHAMMRPKIGGLLALEEAAPNVDFTVLFSSTAALTGAFGMAHYAAANAFLDASAHHAKGPVVAVNWGTWDVMRTATEADFAALREGGMNTLESAFALDAMGSLIASGVRRAAIADIDWSRLKPLYERARPRPFLAAFGDPAAPYDPAAGADAHGTPELLELLAGVPADAAAATLETFVREAVAATLGLPDGEAVPVATGLFDLGMDSLMAVALQRRLERAIGRSLPSTLTFNHPSAGALARYLARTLAVGTSAAPAPSHQAAATLTVLHEAEIDALTDAEVEMRLLARLEGVG